MPNWLVLLVGLAVGVLALAGLLTMKDSKSDLGASASRFHKMQRAGKAARGPRLPEGEIGQATREHLKKLLREKQGR